MNNVQFFINKSKSKFRENKHLRTVAPYLFTNLSSQLMTNLCEDSCYCSNPSFNWKLLFKIPAAR